jgi:hypothetical protein
LLSEAAVRTRESLVETSARTLSADTVRDAWCFFERCSYRRVDYFEVRYIVRRLSSAKRV